MPELISSAGKAAELEDEAEAADPDADVDARVLEPETDDAADAPTADTEDLVR